MKYLKENWQYITICALFLIYACFLPNTNVDWIWKIFKFGGLDTFMSLSNGKLVASTIALLLTKYKLLKIITYGILSASIFTILKNIVNKKNTTLMWLGAFLLLLMSGNLFTSTYISTTGFSENVVSILFLLIVMNYLIKDTLYKLPPLSVFTLGFISSFINIETSLTLLIAITIKVISNIIDRETDQRMTILFIASIVGLIGLNLSMTYAGVVAVDKNIISNLFNNLVPNVYSINFILYFLEIVFAFLFSIKIFTKGSVEKKTNIILAIGSITLFAVAYFFSSNTHLNYILYLLFTIATYYIFKNVNNSIVFKRKIETYYLFKLIYLAILIFIPNALNYMLFPIIIEILIILELINYVFPQNYLRIPWMVIVALTFAANIYIMSVTYYKIRDMDNYVKTQLECDITRIDLPRKYILDDIDFFLPKEEDESTYIKYLGIKRRLTYKIEK